MDGTKSNMHLFFDTETTGTPKKYGIPPEKDVDNWPRAVEVAWMLFDGQENEISRHKHIIKPVGFKIPIEATEIHGITTERANAEGSRIETVLDEFSKDVDNAKSLVAHNIDFDNSIMSAEFIRANIKHKMGQKRQYCTMRDATEYCRIPGNYGYKWPELHKKLFGMDFANAHDALADVAACAKCFFELQRRGVKPFSSI